MKKRRESLREALDNWHEKADGESSCDYAFHLALTDWNEEISRELGEIAAKETMSFKLYMTYDTMVDDETMYQILARFYTLGLNLIKLESRPLPDREFEFMFYFDLETSIYSQEFVQLMCELDDLCEEFKYLGSYSEVV